MSNTFKTWRKQHDSEDLQPFSYDVENLAFSKIKNKDLIMECR